MYISQFQATAIVFIYVLLELHTHSSALDLQFSSHLKIFVIIMLVEVLNADSIYNKACLMILHFVNSLPNDKIMDWS